MLGVQPKLMGPDCVDVLTGAPSIKHEVWVGVCQTRECAISKSVSMSAAIEASRAPSWCAVMQHNRHSWAVNVFMFLSVCWIGLVLHNLAALRRSLIRAWHCSYLSQTVCCQLQHVVCRSAKLGIYLHSVACFLGDLCVV